jgi:peroxiredoxin
MKRLFAILLLAGSLPMLAAARVNAPAPGFKLPDSRGVRRTLADYKGKVVLINFWASWCAPCRAELGELDRLAREFAHKPVKVLTINVDKEKKLGKGLLVLLELDRPGGFDVLWDTRSKAVSAYNIETMPSSFIVDKRGVIRFTHSGFRPEDPAAWRREIASLLQ